MWSNLFRSRHFPKGARLRPRFRPSYENLEERCVPSVYNNAADFSATDNPNGGWSYGYLAPSPTPEMPNASTFSLFTNNGTSQSIDYWNGPDPVLGAPAVNHNPTNNVIDVQLPGGTITYQPHQASSYPSPNGEYSVYRFTAPSDGDYSISVTFTSIDQHGGADKDIHVLNNGNEIYGDILSGSYGSTNTYSTIVGLAEGDQVDFVVGDGTGPFYYDTTAVDATLTTDAGGGAARTAQLGQQHLAIVSAQTDSALSHSPANALPLPQHEGEHVPWPRDQEVPAGSTAAIQSGFNARNAVDAFLAAHHKDGQDQGEVWDALALRFTGGL